MRPAALACHRLVVAAYAASRRHALRSTGLPQWLCREDSFQGRVALERRPPRRRLTAWISLSQSEPSDWPSSRKVEPQRARCGEPRSSPPQRGGIAMGLSPGCLTALDRSSSSRGSALSRPAWRPLGTNTIVPGLDASWWVHRSHASRPWPAGRLLTAVGAGPCSCLADKLVALQVVATIADEPDRPVFKNTRASPG
jgi:hypothetical protein